MQWQHTQQTNATQSIAMPKHIFGAHANICRIRIFVYILVQILQITRQRSLATPQIHTHTHTHCCTPPTLVLAPPPCCPPEPRVMHNVFTSFLLCTFNLSKSHANVAHTDRGVVSRGAYTVMIKISLCGT